MKGLNFLLTLLLLVISVRYTTQAQSIPVGLNRLESFYRDMDLADTMVPSISQTIRPLFRESIPFTTSSQVGNFSSGRKIKIADKLGFTLLPGELQTQFNSHHPYGWNDGSIIPAKGIQTVFSGGFYLDYGILSVQIRPEIITASNQPFDTFDKEHYGVIFARYYDVYNNTDLPARFGEGNYTQAYFGQSSIRLNYGAASLGISSENLWWGPGIRSSLLMSNTAPGFKHLTLNTRRPVHTLIGSFEGQLIAGKLEGSGFSPLTPDYNYLGTSLYIPKNTDWRYLSGFVLTWNPKWVPGLFLGMAKTAQSYSKDLDGLSTYLPFFSTKRASPGSSELRKRDELGSVFMRWVWPQSQAEIYFEYGVQNNSNSSLNSLLEPQDARAYVFGLRKAVNLNTSKKEILLISVEATQMQETSAEKILAGTQWYVNSYIRHGYTNRGEVLGAGIGPGANLQSLDISWMSGLNKAGLQFERYLHNNDFYYYAFADSQDFRRHWVDLSVAGHLDWNFGRVLINTKLTAAQSLNYQWFLKQFPGDPFFVNGKSALNIQLQAGAIYRF